MNRKIIIVTLAILTAAVVMTACMNSGANNNAVQPTPTATAGFMPDLNNNTGMTNSGTTNAGRTSENSNGALGVFDWANNAASIEEAISRISEISESRVVVVDKTALVGVKFAPEYKGELTERIREMVAAEVKKADPSIQSVAVTAVEEDVSRIYGLSDKMRSGNPVEAMAAEINEIIRNATTLR
jgi:YhcN/YlaJ family sporulation lipoprotein